MSNPIDRDSEHSYNNYDYPIPSREIILSVLSSKPMLLEDALDALNVKGWARDAVGKRLEAMWRDDQVEKSKEGYFISSESMLVEARIESSKSGDLMVQIGGCKLLLSYRHSQGIFPHDKVMVRVPNPVTEKSKPIPIKVLESCSRHIVCHVSSHKGRKRLLPFDKRIKHFLDLKKINTYKEGVILLVKRAEKQPNRRQISVVPVSEIGSANTPGIEREIARNLFHLHGDWDSSLMPNLQDEIDEQLATRTSWVDLPFVTIDGSDAKDFDDAVYATKTKSGYQLYVAIADVAHYIKQGSEIDIEARSRGNSVYFPGFVIPMLPEYLSNEYCSLKPDVNRLAMGACMDIDHKGNVTNCTVQRVVIRSHARLIYEDVTEMIKNEQYPDHISQSMSALNEVAHLLHKKRVEQGAIEFSSSEPKFDFSEDRTVCNIRKVQRGWAHQLIEECMLCANQSIGQFLNEHNQPFIKRSHDAPSADRVENLREYLAFHRIEMPLNPKPKDFQQVLNQAPKPMKSVIEPLLLRTMSQAHYSAEDDHHFALSCTNYTHFTSPIRRYVDLTVHRALLSVLDGQQGLEDLESIASSCSQTERHADEASWFAQAWLKTQYISSHVNQVFTGRVISVTHFGLFVELDKFPIEGLIHISNLGSERFVYDQESLVLRGKSSNKVYMQGKSIKVVVVRAAVLTQQVDFHLAEN
ncbi:ribonuclease R [Candidatus Comchoanobacter bicostacola]|uniref:Ribonuclease R n=1 Tax=Candidatus Comchoanobacter bicostacola TaxID=2919598 RepID=A0ABY5DNC6_9GAMM|nr:ribonuclease R [Candidatus Comchoanobacter bicostacola]UTC24949.1 ribonuclease R [Candidatus Comchoanobacter bicostacola]